MSSDLDTEKAHLRRAAEILGGQAAVAVACGFQDRRHVWPWFNTDRRVPAEHCPAIEKATLGQVRCEDLRPDIEWSVLRGGANVTPNDWPPLEEQRIEPRATNKQEA